MRQNAQITIHLIPNAHIDPVWLWDWREGLNEAWQTCLTITSLMEEYEDLTFIRGEAVVYDHIRRYDPVLFKRIKRLVEQGRWEIVGGTWLQPDTNLACTETYCRHFREGQNYFREHFDRHIEVAWAADSFGHASGLPEIFASAGIRYFAFTRPQATVMPLSMPVFHWEGPGGSRVLCYRPNIGWYGTDRGEIAGRFDEVLADAEKTGMKNVALFFGLGNHGGGPSRREIMEIRKWAKNKPDIHVVFSGLSRLFRAIEDEFAVSGKSIPVRRGELNFVLRGCYASTMQFKSHFFKAEQRVSQAETTAAVLAAGDIAPIENADTIWRDVLFNSFHDILPGSSIERATHEQLQWISGTLHHTRELELRALNALAREIDSSVPTTNGDYPSAVPVMLWNPNSRAYHGLVEMEVALDYRPLFAYTDRVDDVPVEVLGPLGNPQLFQVIETEHRFKPNIPWRCRVVVPVSLGPWGWSVYTIGYREQPRQKEPVKNNVNSNVPVSDAPVIANQHFRIQAVPGSEYLEILSQGENIFSDSGLGFAVYDDSWGSWGGHEEEPDSYLFTSPKYTLQINDAVVQYSGPLRSQLWVKWSGEACDVELTLQLDDEDVTIQAYARVYWYERSTRLKMILPAGDRVEYQVPGGTVERKPCGEVPGGRYAVIHGERNTLGFVTDSISSFDSVDGNFRPTICRSSPYATDGRVECDEQPWIPRVDQGEFKFRFALTTDVSSVRRIAEELCRPIVAQTVPATAGEATRVGNLGGIDPECIEFLALKAASDGNGYVLRLRNAGPVACIPKLSWMGHTLTLDLVESSRIRSWRLFERDRAWYANPCDTIEVDYMTSELSAES